MSKAKNRLSAIIAVTALFASVGYWQLFSAPNSSNSASSLFIINSGAGVSEIAQNLQNHRLIRSRNAFLLMAKIRQLDAKIHQGRYKLSGAMNLQEILEAIGNPKQVTVSVTIPEGFTVHDIDERLTELGLIEASEFSMVAIGKEGYLFPDTYFVNGLNFNPNSLIKQMQNNFVKKVTPQMSDDIKKQKRTLEEVITMASILEKEVKTEKDYPIVAGILWKRLASGWPLQADATLLYGKDASTLSGKDLKEDSPYNTRKFKGLPPTPINNPGLVAIKAAIYPEASKYWFYLTDREGNVHYAASNEEHNINRAKYLE
ncbi:endolytic transglycosylase MltG [Candidatus Peregrinibacteria bacterium]|nr:endolytic transglycosylase MltG [Candidatus Peregrinibacteria bacterium]